MTERTSLLPLVEALRDAKVLCIGDLMLDRFVYGGVDRISPEAPIPVLRVERDKAMLGGAGNVVRNVVSLGGSVAFVSVVGDDAAGREVEHLLTELKTVTQGLVNEAQRPTSIKTRFLAAGQQMLRADRETVAPIAEISKTALLAAAEKALESAAIMVLSDYGKGVLANGTAKELIALAKAAGKPVIVDPKGTDYSIYEGASLITPNRKELHEASRLPVNTDEQIVMAAEALIENCGIDAVLATRSQDGMTLVRKGFSPLHLAAEAREVFDVSGAGDTVVATLAAALAIDASIEDAAELANVAAGIVVAKVGTAAVHADELARGLHHQDLEDTEAKVATLEQAMERVERWRLQGHKVGFTNGCFDLLHPGHVSLLSQAKAACDRLIVGLNSDSSVQGLKGPTRPVQNETARSTVLSSLEMVDLVVLFSDETPLRLISALLPDVLVKGADYTVDTVVGADIVQKNGGKVVLAQLVEGQSTTKTISRMNG